MRGSVEVSVVKNDLGNLPVIIKILYDGQDFGEYVNLKESEDVTPELIEQLNRQKCTTKANELCYIFSFSKEMIKNVIEKGLQSEFEKIVTFLQNLEIFKE